MNRISELLTIALMTFLTSLAGVAPATAQAEAPLALAELSESDYLGKSGPSFSLPDLHGSVRNAEEWRGNVVVVNFWATWCAPCKKEIPIFNKIQAEYESKGVRFIGIALDDDKAVERFMEIIPIDYSVLIGDLDAVKISQQYGNIKGVLPYTAFLDRSGRIASIAAGGLTEEATRRAIEKLL